MGNQESKSASSETSIPFDDKKGTPNKADLKEEWNDLEMKDESVTGFDCILVLIYISTLKISELN